MKLGGMEITLEQLRSMPLDELKLTINWIDLMDSAQAARFLDVSQAAMRSPKGRYQKLGLKIGQYWFWRRVDLLSLSESDKLNEAYDRYGEAKYRRDELLWSKKYGQYFPARFEDLPVDEQAKFLEAERDLLAIEFAVRGDPELSVCLETTEKKLRRLNEKENALQ